jgi:hypothetical protein
MEISVELMVMLGLGFILMVFIGVFAYNWSPKGGAESLLSELDPSEETPDFRLSADQLPGALFSDLENCSRDSGRNSTYHVTGEGMIGQEWLFQKVKALGWCKSMQSSQFSCGTREDVNMTNITLPAVIRSRCTNGTLEVN